MVNCKHKRTRPCKMTAQMKLHGGGRIKVVNIEGRKCSKCGMKRFTAEKANKKLVETLKVALKYAEAHPLKDKTNVRKRLKTNPAKKKEAPAKKVKKTKK